jgi:hypothetical protein
LGILERILEAGGEVIKVEGEALKWPGPMWRFLALDDPMMHRVLFRDADSVISEREVGAVQQWLESGKRFHIMRDWGSHTELMLAGLWGVVGKSLPPFSKLMEFFLKSPIESQHFADQFFLRQFVWPYARKDMLQHDSIFGFMDPVPFPGTRPDNFHVGYAEGSPFFTANSALPDKSPVIWTLSKVIKLPDGSTGEKEICSYSATVKNGQVQGNIPARYARGIVDNTYIVRVTQPEKLMSEFYS